jgi:hypothetical protein
LEQTSQEAPPADQGVSSQEEKKEGIKKEVKVVVNRAKLRIRGVSLEDLDLPQDLGTIQDLVPQDLAPQDRDRPGLETIQGLDLAVLGVATVDLVVGQEVDQELRKIKRSPMQKR